MLHCAFVLNKVYDIHRHMWAMWGIWACKTSIRMVSPGDSYLSLEEPVVWGIKSWHGFCQTQTWRWTTMCWDVAFVIGWLSTVTVDSRQLNVLSLDTTNCHCITVDPITGTFPIITHYLNHSWSIAEHWTSQATILCSQFDTDIFTEESHTYIYGSEAWDSIESISLSLIFTSSWIYPISKHPNTGILKGHVHLLLL